MAGSTELRPHRAGQPRQPERARLVCLLGLCTPLASCALAFGHRRHIPMKTLRIPAQRHSQDLVIFLPGAYSTPEEFAEEGFLTLMQQAGVHADAWMADANLSYFGDGSMWRRLEADVFGPARTAGYARIHLVGISLGGLLTLATLADEPSWVHSALVLAPYLGPRRLWRDIQMAGGLLAWSATPSSDQTALPLPNAQALDDEVLARRALRFLAHSHQQARMGQAEGPPRLINRLHMGWGLQDRYAQAQASMATLLPPGHGFSLDGGHDWPAWRRLWAQYLAHGPLAGRAAPATGLTLP
jgi:hypothetical protein